MFIVPNYLLFSVIRCHLNNIIIKQNSCYLNNKTFITLFCFNIKQKYVKELTNINGRDVQRKNVVNNVDKSNLWAP